MKPCRHDRKEPTCQPRCHRAGPSDPLGTRRFDLSLRRYVCALLVTAVPLLCGSTATAQQRTRAPREQSASSPFRKLDLLQQSVKQKLKHALGVNDPPQTAAVDQASESRTAQGQRTSGSPATGQSDASQFSGQPSADAVQYYENQQQLQQRLPVYDNQTDGVGRSSTQRPTPLGAPSQFRPSQNSGDSMLQGGAVVAATEVDWVNSEYPQQPFASQNPMRAVEYREPFDRSMPTYDAVGRPVPAPMNEIPAPAPSQMRSQQGYGPQEQRWGGDMRGGHSAIANSGFDSGVPLVRGSILGDSQITATQHALRLIEENGDLKAKLAMIDSENKRLKEKLAYTETLHARSTEAVEAAYQEIEATRLINRDLQKKLADAEQQHNRYLMETDRMLQSIREELDDVLVREISANGN